MAIDTIKSSAVLDGAIATADIADNAVTGDKVSDTLVIASQLQTPSVAGSADTDTSVSFPGSNIVQMNNGATARHKFHNLNGNSRFEVESSSTGGSGAGGAMIRFKGSNGTAVDIASIDGSMTNGTATSESGILSFFTMNSGTSSEKARIFSNGAMAVPNGIAIGNGINAAASNLLDDYEEGTFTAQISTDSTYTGETQSGVYTKIGDICYIQIRFQKSGTLNSGVNARFGLPFTSANNGVQASGFRGSVENIDTSMVGIGGTIAANSSILYLNEMTAATTGHNVNGNDLGANFQVQIQGFYKTT